MDTDAGHGRATSSDHLSRSVGRAKDELRRGQPVAIVGGDGSQAVVMAAETLTQADLDRLRRWVGPGAQPLLVLTENRASVLHIKPSGHKVIRVRIGADMDAALLRGLADPSGDLDHPLRGPFERLKGAPGQSAEAAVQLCKLARLLPAAIIAPTADATAIARRDDILSVAAGEIAAYDEQAALALQQVAAARVPLADAGDARMVAFRPADGGVEHFAILIGDPKPATRESGRPVLVRLHSECFTGDLLGSLRCDCGEQLRGAVREIAREGSGILLYLAQEGRGIGLVNKLRAYRLQDQGFDTVDANQRLGFDADERIFLPAAQILKKLGFAEVRLMTNNPAKVEGLQGCGIVVVERVPHAFPANNHNEAYLATKKKRSGHYL